MPSQCQAELRPARATRIGLCIADGGMPPQGPTAFSLHHDSETVQALPSAWQFIGPPVPGQPSSTPRSSSRPPLLQRCGCGVARPRGGCDGRRLEAASPLLAQRAQLDDIADPELVKSCTQEDAGGRTPWETLDPLLRRRFNSRICSQPRPSPRALRWPSPSGLWGAARSVEKGSLERLLPCGAQGTTAVFSGASRQSGRVSESLGGPGSVPSTLGVVTQRVVPRADQGRHPPAASPIAAWGSP